MTIEERREKKTLYMRGWRAANRERSRTRARRTATYERWLDAQLANPERAAEEARKRRVRRKLRYAIESGKIVRQPCEECGAHAQAHHDDYDRPLDVRWLCPPHHAREHIETFDLRLADRRC